MKHKIKLGNIMCAFIILCPILDIVSFIFRNTFNLMKALLISRQSAFFHFITCTFIYQSFNFFVELFPLFINII